MFKVQTSWNTWTRHEDQTMKCEENNVTWYPLLHPDLTAAIISTESEELTAPISGGNETLEDNLICVSDDPSRMHMVYLLSQQLLDTSNF